MNRRRTVITALAFAVGLAFVVAMFFAAPSNKSTVVPASSAKNSAVTNKNAQNKDKSAAAENPASPVLSKAENSKQASSSDQSLASKGASSDQKTAPVDSDAKDQQPSAAEKIAVKPIAGLHVVKNKPASDYLTLGSSNPDSNYAIAVRLVDWGAGVDKVTLSHYATTVKSKQRYTVITPVTAQRRGEPKNPYLAYSFAARSIAINGSKPIQLQSVKWLAGQVQKTPVNQSVQYSLIIADGSGKPVLKILRTYTVTKGKTNKQPGGSYDLLLRQKLINLSGQPLKVVWSQNALGDVPRDKSAYLGDRRVFVTGYLTPNGSYSKRVTTTDGFTGRSSILSTVVEDQKKGDSDKTTGGLWPNPSITKDSRLVWVGMLNRYFAVTAHPILAKDAKNPADIIPLQAQFPNVGVVVMPSGNQNAKADAQDRAAVVTLTSDKMVLMPGQSKSLDMGIYAGPRDSSVFARWPYSVMSFGEMVRYEIECSWITFQWLANLLLAFLKLIHFIFGDWGVAIILLVVVVRGLLHPLTKHAQINMMKMGKAMQSMQPEMEKLKKKYKDEQQTLNKEMMKLYREKGVNPANMLGCLPMLLQTPIWIALYAMLYFAIELRHQPAFYGVFQWISGGHWMFLADLSTADHFYQFGGHGFTLPLIFINPTFNSINILPILMAVVFYFQQKFMTPPAATEQAKSQQKMMKFMVLLFPVMLYSLPSGLNLYILASTAVGVVDSYFVRKQVQEREAAGTLFTKKQRKKGGLMDRIQKRIEKKRLELEQGRSSAAAGGRGGKKAGGRQRGEQKNSKQTYKNRRKK